MATNKLLMVTKTFWKIYHDEQWFDECVFPIKITDIDELFCLVGGGGGGG